MSAEAREDRCWDFGWILDAVGADPTGHLPNCGLDIDTGTDCACSKVGYRLSLALAQHDARLVADAERRGAERAWDEGFNARVRWQLAEAGGQMVRGALLSNPYRADAQTPSKQGETP